MASWLGRFEHMRQRKPRPFLAFCHVARRLEQRGGPQILFGIRLPAFRELQSQIQIRLKHIRLRRHRFAIRRNRVLCLANTVLHKAQFKPRYVIRRIVAYHFPQQRLGPGIVMFLNQILGMSKLGRRCGFLGDRSVMDLPGI